MNDFFTLVIGLILFASSGCSLMQTTDRPPAVPSAVARHGGGMMIEAGQSEWDAKTRQARATVHRLGISESYPFDHQFLSTPLGAMHYVDQGVGDPILMLHGNPSWSFLYREFISDLSRDHRVIAPDHLGFGLSDKPGDESVYTLEQHVQNIESLMVTLDLRNVTLVVQDWGGPIGLTAAARHPERVKALVVLNTLGFYPHMDRMDPDHIRLPLPLRAMRSRGMGDLMVRRWGLFEKKVMPSAIASRGRWKQVRKAYTGVFCHPDQRAGVMAFPRMIPVNRKHPSAKILIEETGPYVESFAGPVKIYWGMKDIFFPPEVLQAWQRRLPHAEVVELPGAKHYIQEDAAEIIVPGIRDFIARTR